jgi:hypothetical protein
MPVDRAGLTEGKRYEVYRQAAGFGGSVSGSDALDRRAGITTISHVDVTLQRHRANPDLLPLVESSLFQIVCYAAGQPAALEGHMPCQYK